MGTAYILAQTEIGEIADFTSLPDYDPANKPVVDAPFLRRLMLGLEAKQPLAPGVRIKGARIEGKLDLADCAGAEGRLPALALEDCDLPDRVDLSGAQITRLSFDRSRFRELWVYSAQIDGDFTFLNAEPLPAQSEGEDVFAYIRARDVRVKGSIWGLGAKLKMPRRIPAGMTQLPPVLNFQSASVEGDFGCGADANTRFEAEGDISLQGAKIGGSVGFSGALLRNTAGLTLNLDMTEVGGAVFLSGGRFGFDAHGTVALRGTRIGGDLILTGAVLHDTNIALSGHGLHAGGTVYMNESDVRGFRALGPVILSGARIGGLLDCTGGSFAGHTGSERRDLSALDLSHAQVDGSVLFESSDRNRFTSKGVVRMVSIRVRGNLSCTGALMEGDGTRAFIADGGVFDNDVTFFNTRSQIFEAVGSMLFDGVRISGDLSFSGAVIRAQNAMAIQAEGATIGGAFLYRSVNGGRAECHGTVWLLGATIGGNVVFSGAIMNQPGGTAFNAQLARIRGTLQLMQFSGYRLECTGMILLTNATIEGDVNCPGLKLVAGDVYAVSGVSCRINGSVQFGSDAQFRTEVSGIISFAGAEIAGSFDMSGAKLSCVRERSDMVLDLQLAKVGGAVFLSSKPAAPLEVDGRLWLNGVDIGGDLQLEGSQLRNPGASTFNASTSRISGAVLFKSIGDLPFRSAGIVSLSNATIGGKLEFIGGLFELENGVSLHLDGMRVSGHLMAVKNQIVGNVQLSGAWVRQLADKPTTGWDGAGRLFLDGFTYDLIETQGAVNLVKVRSEWLKRNIGRRKVFFMTIPDGQFSHLPWRTCADALDRAGFSSEARKVRREGLRESNRFRGIALFPAMRALGAQRQFEENMVRFESEARMLQRIDEGLSAEDEKHMQRTMWLGVLTALLWPLLKPYTLLKQFSTWLFAELPFGYGLSATRAAVTCICVWMAGAYGVHVAEARGVLVDDSGDVAKPCGRDISPALYALDTAIPIIELGQQSQCVPGSQPGKASETWRFELPVLKQKVEIEEIAFWRWAKALYAILGGLTIGFSILTWTGVFRPHPKEL